MLSNAAVKSARPMARAYKMFDERGLHLYVAPTGLRAWRMKYRHQGKEKLLTFGRWPDLSLAEAREHCTAARDRLALGEDPSASPATRADVQICTFESMARAWHQHHRSRWTDRHAEDVLDSLVRDAFPSIGSMAIGTITPPDVLRALRLVEGRGSVETARRLRQRISAVFAYAISVGETTQDPATIVAKALQPPAIKRHQPALIDLDEVRALLDAAELVDAKPIVKLASRFLALTAVRMAALRGATWDEFDDIDWDGTFIGPLRPTWRVPAARMKLAKAKKANASFAHLVPLSLQAVEVLRAARAIAGGGGLVFRAGAKNLPLGSAAVGEIYVRAGFAGRHVPHGWRASFSTVLNERFPDERAAIDRALAHVPKDKVEAAYNRAEQLGRRRRLYQRWADLLGKAA
ncbi:MAG: integrase arm-type DNA-binding domain-containing protein [Sphingobium sp.]|uniref:tyrosine-type recombinase/integrase n=1 Tax=Sphingobium sp. TaxID=1912891 RepID=UPI0029AA1612|nr:integrase arm-type DNA-binding domain-containing protein [Sphingobium sp.]MDX3908438.1 integrase arm-type DNA-binding domain-containing protein [Sphingobium sp.]